MCKFSLVILALVVPGLFALRLSSRAATKGSLSRPAPLAIVFKDAEKELRLLSGPPQTQGYRSGFVVLQKGQSMHEHSTERYEEALIIIEGAGTASLIGHEDIAFKAGTLIYIPPETRHSIKNTGETPLRYVYLVAPTRK